MFLLDSLMIAGIRWTLETVVTAAEAEMNDDSVLRERLLEAEMRRELGELTDEEFRALEADLLARIRAIRVRRDGGAEPLHLAGALTPGDSPQKYSVDAQLTGDFHEPVRSDPRDVIVSADTVTREAAVPKKRKPRAAASRQPRGRRTASRTPRARRS